MNLEFTDEEGMVISLVQDFAEGELLPIAERLDREGKVPIDQIRKMQELGFFGLIIPEEYGGAGVSGVAYTEVIDHLSRVCAAIAITLSVHNSVGAFPILKFGNEEQKKRYLPKLATKWIGAFALTEADAGSDAAQIKLKAERDGDDYVLNGAKLYVTNGKIADLYLVMARTSESAEAPHRGISSFLIERDTPGLRVGKLEEKMGIRASDTAEIIFEDCRVPAASLLGEEGEGFKIAMMSLDNGRIGVGAQAVGIATAAFDDAVRYAKERHQFGKPLAAIQAIQFMLADMATQLDAARALVRRAAWLKDSGQPHTTEAAMAKLFASQMATRVTHSALQIHGGYGYIKEYPVERYYRDARVTEIYEGTSQMQHLVISRGVLRS